MKLSRRETLTLATGGAALAAFGPVGARAAATQDAIAAFSGGAAIGAGRIRLHIQEIIENGDSAPVAVTIESPMTAEDHVVSVLILADGNPTPTVATMHFSPLSGVAEASTRIRLAASQRVIAIARMSDGAVFMDHRDVSVVIGGCGG